MVYKLVNGLAPDNLSSKFFDRGSVPSQSNLLSQSRINYTRNSFSYSKVVLWNSLPIELQQEAFSLLLHKLSIVKSNFRVMQFLVIAYFATDHNILLEELRGLEVSPSIISQIAGFFAGSNQAVRIEETLSDWKTLNGGIPQGTQLGVVFYYIYKANFM